MSEIANLEKNEDYRNENREYLFSSFNNKGLICHLLHVPDTQGQKVEWESDIVEKSEGGINIALIVVCRYGETGGTEKQRHPM